jgi:hypothetical protein
VNFGRVFADAPIGAIGRPSSLCERCFEKPTNILPCFIWQCGEILKWPIKKKIFTRKNIYTLTTAEIDTLRAGIAAMKAKPATDPTSWLYQAKMHALNSGSALALQDQCQHRQFFFTAWHRMYTYYFERILRKASGNPSFALPYWNYTDVDAQRIIPEAYRLPANATTNALYNGSRSAVYNGGAALPASDVSYSNAFSLTNFTTPTLGSPSFGGRTVAAPAHFPASSGSGRLEQSPHNNVHNDVGGDMATGESPRDPIFWLHHANIDRLWKKDCAGRGTHEPDERYGVDEHRLHVLRRERRTEDADRRPGRQHRVAARLPLRRRSAGLLAVFPADPEGCVTHGRGTAGGDVRGDRHNQSGRWWLCRRISRLAVHKGA